MANQCDHLKDSKRLCSRQRENKGVLSPSKSLYWDQWSLFSSWRLFEVCLYVWLVPNDVLELKLTSENIDATLLQWGCPSCKSRMIQDVHVAWSSLHVELNWEDPWISQWHENICWEFLSVSELRNLFLLHWTSKKGNYSFTYRRD